MLYKVIMGCTKTSIIILYLRVFPGTDVKQFRMICAVVMVYVVGYAIASTLATLAQCTPVARAWDKGIPGTCINMTAFWYSNAVASISGDIIIFLLPLNRIRKLHLPRKQKGQLLFVFCLGGL